MEILLTPTFTIFNGQNFCVIISYIQSFNFWSKCSFLFHHQKRFHGSSSPVFTSNDDGLGGGCIKADTGCLLLWSPTWVSLQWLHVCANYIISSLYYTLPVLYVIQYYGNIRIILSFTTCPVTEPKHWSFYDISSLEEFSVIKDVSMFTFLEFFYYLTDRHCTASHHILQKMDFCWFWTFIKTN